VIRVPADVPGGMWPTSVKTWPAVTARLGFVQLTVPVAPGDGVEHDQPAGDDSETKVIVPGSGSFSAALEAASGPALVTVMV